jgi:adenylate kinase family enzyme
MFIIARHQRMGNITMNRIVVIGSTGSGKTTLARQLSAQLGLTHIELDALSWGPNWTMLAEDVLRQRLADAFQAHENWVMDGNYSRIRPLTWTKADTLVWLDYPLRVNLWRLTRRTFARAITRENLWGTGNRESFIKHLIPNDNSLYWWLFKTHQRRKREIPHLLTQPEYRHLNLIHLQSPNKTRVWLEDLQG